MAVDPSPRRRSIAIRGAWCLAAVLSLGSLSLGLLGSSTGAAEDSPHGVPGACGSCHMETAADTAADDVVFTHGTADETCMYCHDEDPHVVGVAFQQRTDGIPSAMLPSGWPVLADKLACLTCHDEPACGGKGQDPQNRHYFRGGPYSSVKEFCSRCHSEEQLVGYNPHEAMVERPDSDTVCEFCHLIAPGAEAGGDDLKIAVPTLCAGCHQETLVHAGSTEHLVALDEDYIARAEAAGLPLDGGEVYCGTCHDPHPAGALDQHADRAARLGRPVVPDEWVESILAPTLAARGQERGAVAQPATTEPDFMRLPLEHGELCRACHPPQSIGDEGEQP